MIGARFNVSMQQEPGFAARPYLKKALFSLAGPAPCWSPYFFNDMALESSVLFVRARRRRTNRLICFRCYRRLQNLEKPLRKGARSSKLRVKKSLK
jgi:ribosomal protein L40E